jgi:hypothetical protein
MGYARAYFVHVPNLIGGLEVKLVLNPSSSELFSVVQPSPLPDLHVLSELVLQEQCEQSKCSEVKGIKKGINQYDIFAQKQTPKFEFKEHFILCPFFIKK